MDVISNESAEERNVVIHNKDVMTTRWAFLLGGLIFLAVAAIVVKQLLLIDSVHRNLAMYLIFETTGPTFGLFVIPLIIVLGNQDIRKYCFQHISMSFSF